jgi:hypothetical protein
MTTEYAFRYEQCDVPEGQTLVEWRAARTRPAPRRLRDLLARS